MALVVRLEIAVVHCILLYDTLYDFLIQILLLLCISLSLYICLEERLDKANLLEEHTSNYFVNGRFGFIEDDHVPFHERGTTACYTVCVCVFLPMITHTSAYACFIAYFCRGSVYYDTTVIHLCV